MGAVNRVDSPGELKPGEGTPGKRSLAGVRGQDEAKAVMDAEGRQDVVVADAVVTQESGGSNAGRSSKGSGKSSSKSS